MHNKFLFHLNRWIASMLLLLMIAVPAAQGLGIGTIPTVTITNVSPASFDPTTNGSSTIFYSITGDSGSVDIDICDGGSCSNATIIRNLFNSSNQAPGNNYQVSWNGKKDATLGGGNASPKTYLIRVIASNQYGTSIDTDFVTVQPNGNPQDNTPPTISIVTPVPATTNDTTPNFTFFSNENGTIIYGGDCFSNTFSAGGNVNTTVTFNQLNFGVHNNCTIKVQDAAGNISNTLFIPSFTIIPNLDNTPPVLAVVNAVPNPTSDTTPNFTFSSTEDGVISYQGDCFSNSNSAIAGNNLITFNQLTVGFHSNCIIRVTDAAGNISQPLFVPSFLITGNPQDNTPPVLAVVTPVPNPTNDTTPNFMFSSTEDGIISYQGDCFSNSNSAIAGNNFITFNTLNVGFHSNCIIRVTDAAGNVSLPLFVPSFLITGNPQDNTPPVLAVVNAVPNPTSDTSPNFTFSSTEAGVISYQGDCFSNSNSAIAGNNLITFNQLTVGFHSNCIIRVTDAAGNVSQPLFVPSFLITGNPQDNTPPVLAVVNAVPTPTSDTTPNFTFSSTEDGHIIYPQDSACISNTSTAFTGNNTLTFNVLAPGFYPLGSCSIQVQDNAGNMSQELLIPAFTITGNNPGVVPVISNDSASPNPFDPNTEVTYISYTLNTTADVTVRVWSGNSIIETIMSNVSQIAGVHQVSWDGRNGSNNPYAEDNYTYEIIASNNAGQDNETGNVTIDYNSLPNGTVPSITNDYATPSTFDPYNEDTNIYYTLNTTANVTVRIKSGNTIIENILTGSNQSAGTHNVTWDGRNTPNNPYAEGVYTYEIVATNNAGTDTETGNITIDYNGTNNNGAPNITSDYVTPSTFDPDNELARIYFTIDRSAYVTVEIRDGVTVIRTLADYVYKSSGTYNYSWNGRDKYGNMVNDRTYTYRITATNSYGTDTTSGSLRLDSTGTIIDNNPDDNIGDLVSNVEVTDDIFDPSNNETARICFDVRLDNVDITLTVLDGNSVLRTITDRQLDRQSNYCATWNGRDKYNDIANDSVYRFKLLAEKSGYSDETAYRNIEVDTDGSIIGTDNNNGNCGGFSDGNGAYCKALQYLKLKGIVQGYNDGTYRPFQAIQRDETIKVVLLSLGKAIDSTNGSNLGFWDIDVRAWYMPYLRTAVRLGIIRGYPDGSARMKNNVNRVELAKIFIEATGINVPYCNTSPASDVPVNADTRWSLDYECFVIRNNLMDLDSSGRFNPGAMATRGDVAELFYRYFVNGYNNNNYNNSNYYYNNVQY